MQRKEINISLISSGVMVAWTGLEHFRVGRYDPPPPATEPDDFVVWFLNKARYVEIFV